MISPVTTGKIFSILGNSDSLIPMGIKDTANSLGLTAASYITGQSAESQDRFIDEFGTMAIWLLGIPAYKKVLDWVMFKPLGYDAGVDVRVLQDPEVYDLAKKYAKQHDEKYAANKNVKKISESLEKITSKQRVFKGLTFGKFVASTALTILSYGALTKFRHDYRENKIKKEFYEKQAKEETAKKLNVVSSANQKPVNNGKTSFTGGIQDFMFSPVKNMMLVDGAITGQRLIDSKNGQEFFQYCIKEGFFWFFMYFAGAKVQNYLTKHSLHKNNLPIDLDSRALASDELKNALLGNNIMHSVNEFPVSNNPTNAEIFRFVNENPDNLVVKMSKESGIVKTVKENQGLFKKAIDTGSVDTRKYIDPQEVIGVKDKLKALYDKGQEFIQKEADAMGKKVSELTDADKTKLLERYFEKVKRGNGWASIKSIGACIGVLGILMPAIIVGWRFLDKDNKGYRVREDIEKQLKAEIASAGSTK